MRLFAFALVFGLAGCGASEAGPSLGAVVTVEAALAAQISTVNFYVLGPKLSDGTFLPCDMLRLREIAPTDGSKVDLLASMADVVFNNPDGGSATLRTVEAGGGRVVYVAAFDASRTMIANGCTAGVIVRSDETTQVEVAVYHL